MICLGLSYNMGIVKESWARFYVAPLISALEPTGQ